MGIIVLAAIFGLAVAVVVFQGAAVRRHLFSFRAVVVAAVGAVLCVFAVASVVGWV